MTVPLPLAPGVPAGLPPGVPPMSAAPALVVVAHGSRDPAALRTVGALLASVRAARPGTRALLGHIELDAPLLADTLAGLPAGGEVVLVPLLFGRGHHVKHDIPAALAAAPHLRGTVAAPLGPHPLLAEALYDRLSEALGDRLGEGLREEAPGEGLGRARESRLDDALDDRLGEDPHEKAPGEGLGEVPGSGSRAGGIRGAGSGRDDGFLQGAGSARGDGFLRDADSGHGFLRGPGSARGEDSARGPGPGGLSAARPRLRSAARPDAVILASAGSRDPDSLAGTRRIAVDLRTRLGGGTPVVPAYASAAAPTVPEAARALRAAGHRRIALASCFTAPGRFAARCADEAPWVAASPLGPHPALIRLVLHRFDEARRAAERGRGRLRGDRGRGGGDPRGRDRRGGDLRGPDWPCRD